MDRFNKLFDELFNDFFLNFDSTWNHRSIGYSNPDSNKDINKNIEEGEENGIKWKRESWSDGNGYFRSVSYYYSKPNLNEEKSNDSEISKESLKHELEKAIKEERYEDAAKLRDKIKEIK